MSNDRDDAQGRQDTSPFDQQLGAQPDRWQAPPSAPPSAPPQYGQPQYGQPQYGPPQYGQQWSPQPYGQAQPYAQSPYGQQQYGPAPYGAAQPARPGAVITAAVLGLVLGALGLLVTVGLLVGGALIDDLADAFQDPSLDTGVANDVRAVLVLLAVLALAWTVVMVWGAVLALRGRSRVLLLVGAAISVAATGLFFLGSLVSATQPPSEDGAAGGVLFTLVLFLAALATLVLLCLRSAAQFFAASRQRRALPR
jgi:hypothetical protein